MIVAFDLGSGWGHVRCGSVAVVRAKSRPNRGRHHWLVDVAPIVIQGQK
jgi:hypothetical protein